MDGVEQNSALFLRNEKVTAPVYLSFLILFLMFGLILLELSQGVELSPLRISNKKKWEFVSSITIITLIFTILINLRIKITKG